MENMSTPGLEHNPSNASNSLFSGSSADSIPSSSSSETPLHSQANGNGQQAGQSQSAAQKYSNGPHIRSRITVVCAECKRLKLKCDRRTPCSSCLKRDTVQRCVYSQAAAEKIDVQSLHNRLLVVEGHLAQLTTVSPTSVPPFRSSYPGSTPPQPSSAGTSHNPTSSLATRAPTYAVPSNDRALLVTGNNGSSVVVSLDDTASIWLNEVDGISLTGEDSMNSGSKSSGPPYAPSRSGSSSSVARVKLEPTPICLSFSSSPTFASSTSATTLSSPMGHTSGLVAPIPHSVFLPLGPQAVSAAYGSSSSAFTSTFSSVPESSAPSSSRVCDPPQVTPALLRYLPATPNVRTRYMQALKELMMIHPCFNVPHFDQRIDAMLAWGEATGGPSSKRDLAREVFFGNSSTTTKKSSPGKDRNYASISPKPTLSFFSATCMAYALGALMIRDNAPPTSSDPTSLTDPFSLFSLSEQSLSLFEKTSAYDVDSIIAMILQVLFMLHDGQMRVTQNVFTLVGKMVNAARMMGLAMDPDEFVGTYNVFDAETRRRVWWDVVHYDQFISECMGQQPLILEGSYTTKLPAEVDEDKFGPSTGAVPNPPTEDGEPVPTYLVLKFRLAQLIKGVRRSFAKDSEDALDIESAASCETDVANWLADLPPAYRLNMELDVAHPLTTATSTSPFLLAQRCDLVIAANRVIMKLYLPFMKEAGQAGGSRPSHQALMGTINAAHTIIYASRVLYSLWKETRPAAFDFYDYGRSLFDAAVVCAHAVIQQPKNILTAEAMKGVSGALEVLRAIDSTKAGAEPSEAVRVVELMKEKAERARSPEPTNAGSKRKRNDSSAQRDAAFANGFQLPFVGPPVSSTRPDHPRPAPLVMSKIAISAASKKDAQCSPPEAKKVSKDKDKSAKYPPVGIRVRSPAGNASSTAIASPRVPPPSAGSGRGSISPPDRSNQSSTTGSHAMMYNYPPSHAPPSAPPQSSVNSSTISTHDFPMDFSSVSSNTEDPARYHSAYSNSPSASSGYDAPAPHTPYENPSHSNASYRPPGPEYYMSSFASVPPTYDQSGIGQSMSVPGYPLASPIDSAMAPSGLNSSVPSVPNTPRDSYMIMPDKAPAHYDHVGKSELQRQMSHEYQPTATSHGISTLATPMNTTTSYIQGWQPDPQWNYKYYNQH